MFKHFEQQQNVSNVEGPVFHNACSCKYQEDIQHPRTSTLHVGKNSKTTEGKRKGADAICSQFLKRMYKCTDDRAKHKV